VTTNLPKVGVVIGYGSATLPEVLRHSAGLVEPVLIFDQRDHRLATLPEQFQHEVSCLVIDPTDLPSAAGKLAGLTGMLTFSDEKLRLTAALADRADLPFHTPDIARMLTDKAAQRARLSEAGFVVRHAVARTAAEVAGIVDDFAIECVVKPLHGSGSRNVFLVAPGQPVGADTMPPATFPAIVEERLRPAQQARSPQLAEVFSVETVFHAGRPQHFGMTDRFRLAEPFRETGSLYPAALPADLVRLAQETATATLTALGVRTGVTHTELKLTGDGMTVVEINGRLGGMIGQLTELATGISAIRYALGAAAGAAPPSPARVNRLAATRMIVPPLSAQRLGSPVPARMLRQLPGVVGVDVHLRAGEQVDFREGIRSAVATVWLTGAELSELLACCAAVDELTERCVQWL
jgi:biotin carboxylase